MKTSITFGTLALFASSILAADPGVKDVQHAASKLEDAGSYSWKTTVKSEGGGAGGGGARFRPGPTEGKLGKEGITWLSMTRGDNTTEAFFKGEKGAVKLEDAWKTFAEASESSGDGQFNRGAFLVRMLKNFKNPAAEADDLAEKTKSLKQADGVYSGDLTDEAVKQLLARGPRRPGADAPEATDTKGSVKFWLKDGVLSKYEYNVQGKMTFNNNEISINRTTTVELKDIGSTKVEVPDEAKKKIS